MWKAESLLSQLAHSWKQVPVQRFAFRHCSWQCHFKTVGQKGKDRDQYRDTSSKWTSKGSCHSLQETKKTLKRTSPATSWEMKGSYCLRVFKNTYNVASFLLDSMFQNARAKRWYARDVWEFILEPFDYSQIPVSSLRTMFQHLWQVVACNLACKHLIPWMGGRADSSHWAHCWSLNLYPS